MLSWLLFRGLSSRRVISVCRSSKETCHCPTGRSLAQVKQPGLLPDRYTATRPDPIRVSFFPNARGRSTCFGIRVCDIVLQRQLTMHPGEARTRTTSLRCGSSARPRPPHQIVERMRIDNYHRLNHFAHPMKSCVLRNGCGRERVRSLHFRLELLGFACSSDCWRILLSHWLTTKLF